MSRRRAAPCRLVPFGGLARRGRSAARSSSPPPSPPTARPNRRAHDADPAPHAQYRRARRARGRGDHQPLRARPGTAARRAQGAERFRQRGRPRCRAGDHRHPARRLPRPRHPGRGDRARARREGQRVPVDHRSAGRHDQLPARFPGLRGVDRARAPRRRAAGGGLRPDAQRPVHRLARARRLCQRPQAARQQANAAGRQPGRHRLPVPQGRQLRTLRQDVRAGHAVLRRAAPPGRGGSGPVLRRRRLVRRLLRDGAQPLGRGRRVADDHRGRRAGGQLHRRGRLPLPARAGRRQPQGLRAAGADPAAVYARDRAGAGAARGAGRRACRRDAGLRRGGRG